MQQVAFLLFAKDIVGVSLARARFGDAANA
jgi:hypothetical protein